MNYEKEPELVDTNYHIIRVASTMLTTATSELAEM